MARRVKQIEFSKMNNTHEKARELINKHLYLHGGDGLGISDGDVYQAVLDAVCEALTIPVVGKSLNMEHNATSVEYAEAIIDMHKNPENSNKAFKIVVLENTIDKLRQDLASFYCD